MLVWLGKGILEGGCWYFKIFDKVVVVLIDVLRYDFIVFVDDNVEFYNWFLFMYEIVVWELNKVFLWLFIVDLFMSML